MTVMVILSHFSRVIDAFVIPKRTLYNQQHLDVNEDDRRLFGPFRSRSLPRERRTFRCNETSLFKDVLCVKQPRLSPHDNLRFYIRLRFFLAIDQIFTEGFRPTGSLMNATDPCDFDTPFTPGVGRG